MFDSIVFVGSSRFSPSATSGTIVAVQTLNCQAFI